MNRTVPWVGLLTVWLVAGCRKFPEFEVFPGVKVPMRTVLDCKPKQIREYAFTNSSFYTCGDERERFAHISRDPEAYEGVEYELNQLPSRQTPLSWSINVRNGSIHRLSSTLWRGGNMVGDPSWITFSEYGFPNNIEWRGTQRGRISLSQAGLLNHIELGNSGISLGGGSQTFPANRPMILRFPVQDEGPLYCGLMSPIGDFVEPCRVIFEEFDYDAWSRAHMRLQVPSFLKPDQVPTSQTPSQSSPKPKTPE
jgi:hypothetical protein